MGLLKERDEKMSSHLKQAIFKVSKAGQDLAEQSTGDDHRNLNKAILLGNLIHEVQEMLGHAVDALSSEEENFSFLKEYMSSIDENGELSGEIERLEEATAEEDNWKEDERSMNRFRQLGIQ